jgi:hypothetical protein
LACRGVPRRAEGGPRGVREACDFAKVADQVRLLAGT